MKFLADECCDAPLVESLRNDGHDVLYQLEEDAGAPDEDLLGRAYKEKRILLSEDKDFGELVLDSENILLGSCCFELM